VKRQREKVQLPNVEAAVMAADRQKSRRPENDRPSDRQKQQSRRPDNDRPSDRDRSRDQDRNRDKNSRSRDREQAVQSFKWPEPGEKLAPGEVRELGYVWCAVVMYACAVWDRMCSSLPRTEGCRRLRLPKGETLSEEEMRQLALRKLSKQERKKKLEFIRVGDENPNPEVVDIPDG
jgi:hypothetical protein